MVGAPCGLIAQTNKRYRYGYVQSGISLYLYAVKYCNMINQKYCGHCSFKTKFIKECFNFCLIFILSTYPLGLSPKVAIDIGVTRQSSSCRQKNLWFYCVNHQSVIQVLYEKGTLLCTLYLELGYLSLYEKAHFREKLPSCIRCNF